MKEGQARYPCLHQWTYGEAGELSKANSSQGKKEPVLSITHGENLKGH